MVGDLLHFLALDPTSFSKVARNRSRLSMFVLKRWFATPTSVRRYGSETIGLIVPLSSGEVPAA